VVLERHKVHLYTLCWNDRRMLPHFFEHYNPIVDLFFIFDNGSTDGSLEMLAGDERVRVSHFRTEFDSFAETELRLSEEMWKNSRDLAEWVLVSDIDEHVYHEDLPSYLRTCRERDVTAIQAVGYEMISDEFPGTGRRLCDVVTSGVRCPTLDDKMCLFDPSAITQSNFTHGRHFAFPKGRVRWPSLPEVLLLHYKKLGLDYEMTRSAELRRGLGLTDIERNWGYQYLLTPEEITERFKRAAALAKPVPRGAQEIWEAEFARLRNNIDTLETENRRLSARVADCGAAITTLEARLAAADLEAARLRDELTSREARYRDLEAHAAACSGDVDGAARPVRDRG
jgi:hypothetical protein